MVALGGLPPELADAQILELLKTAEVRAFSETGGRRGLRLADEAQRRRRWMCSGLELRAPTAAIDERRPRSPGASARAGAPDRNLAAAPAVVTLALYNIADDALLASDADRVRADVASGAEMGDVVGAPRLPLPGDAAGPSVRTSTSGRSDAERSAAPSTGAATVGGA